MPIPVSLKAVADEIDSCPQEWTAYINRVTGEMIAIPSEQGEADIEELAADIERVESSGDFLALPDTRDMDEYRLMARFCGMRPSPSNGRERLPRFKNGSSMMVILGLKIC